nr:transposase [Tateyamaria pelophila]
MLSAMARVSRLVLAKNVLSSEFQRCSASSGLPALIREECLDLLAQIAEKTARITERTKKLSILATQSDQARQLQTMPGVGPLTAIAVEAFGPDMAQFKTGRDFAAWLGLVPMSERELNGVKVLP